VHEALEGLGDPRYKALLKAVLDHPYSDRKALAEAAGLAQEDAEKLLAAAVEKMVVLELASQADSSVESRVPKRVYLVNPEMEVDVRQFAAGG